MNLYTAYSCILQQISEEPLPAKMKFLVLFLSLVATGAALSCGTCEREKCPTLSCQGGVVEDVCQCCKECAKLDGQSCGGRFKKYGQCDNGLVCELIVAVGDSLNPNAHGICREKRDPDAIGSYGESSQDSEDSIYIMDCEIKSFSGCNLVNGKCACSEDIQTCINPFQFNNLDECYQAMRLQNGSITPGKVYDIL
ncbi:cysteine-rich motor neuron 1 protein-like [Lytechinus variegatus]|uniref:cysteine-rich motor neuron 1 protein-like n=1 Tax=Lytechinus variegatus TaxID=7654 RepID=UPI001BB113D1|nr:cysteine-rich motor neuron 1 protein-like [Lytechinus variegatus]